LATWATASWQSARRATPSARRRAGSTSAAGSAVGDEYWLKKARSLTLRALGLRLTGSPLALSLYKGALGTAVLAAELPTPGTASMPLFEAERW
jgi:hypothetical protein